mgnify:FL=1
MLSMVGLIVVIFTLLLGKVSDTLLLITPSGDSIAFPDAEASFCKYFFLSFLFLLLALYCQILSCCLFVLVSIMWIMLMFCYGGDGKHKINVHVCIHAQAYTCIHSTLFGN